jgi:hypothetical protein
MLRESATPSSDATIEILGGIRDEGGGHSRGCRRQPFTGGVIASPLRRLRTCLAGAALAAGMLLTADALHAQERSAGASAPSPATGQNEVAAAPNEAAAAQPGARVETVPRQGLLIGGSITFSVAYLFSLAGTAGKSEEPARNWLYVPVAGPFLFLSNRARCTSTGPGSCVDDFLTPVVFTMFGVVQTAGAALFAGGFLFPRERVVGSGRAAASQGDPSRLPLIVTPAVVGQSGVGVAAAGALF